MLKESSDTLLHGKTHSCAAKGLENGKAYVVRARFKCLVGNIALAEYFVPTADSGSLQVAGRRSFRHLHSAAVAGPLLIRSSSPRPILST